MIDLLACLFPTPTITEKPSAKCTSLLLLTRTLFLSFQEFHEMDPDKQGGYDGQVSENNLKAK